MVRLHFRLLSMRLIYRFALVLCSERQTASEVMRVGRKKTTKHTNHTKKRRRKENWLAVSRPIGALRARNRKRLRSYFRVFRVFRGSFLFKPLSSPAAIP